MKLTIPIAAGLSGFFLFSVLSAQAPSGRAGSRLAQLARPAARTAPPSKPACPDKVDPQHPLWTADLPGQSTPVIANGKLYIMGYLGEGPDLQEGVVCFDAETGKELWRQLFSDFLSDTIYLRYATSSPTVDAETGNVYMQGTQGILAAFTARRQTALETFADGGIRPAHLPQQPHRLAGD